MKSINLRKAIDKILSDSMWSGFIISHLVVIIIFAAYAVNSHVSYSNLQSSIIELQKEKIALLEGPLWQDSCHYLKFNQLGR